MRPCGSAQPLPAAGAAPEAEICVQAVALAREGQPVAGLHLVDAAVLHLFGLGGTAVQESLQLRAGQHKAAGREHLYLGRAEYFQRRAVVGVAQH